jgi:hypothetical protein
MKEVKFINGEETLRIEDEDLIRCLEAFEKAGYIVRANRYKDHEMEEFKTVIMVAKPNAMESFFSGKAEIEEFLVEGPKVKRAILKEGGEVVFYFPEESP